MPFRSSRVLSKNECLLFTLYPKKTEAQIDSCKMDISYKLIVGNKHKTRQISFNSLSYQRQVRESVFFLMPANSNSELCPTHPQLCMTLNILPRKLYKYNSFNSSANALFRLSLLSFSAAVTRPLSGVHGSGNSLIFPGISNFSNFAALPTCTS